MTNIALLIPSLAHAGGAEKLVDSLTRVLGARHRVVQISYDEPSSQRYFPSEAPHITLGPAPRLPLVLRWVTYATLAYKLNRVKRIHAIDVTISCLWGADLISVMSGGNDKKIALGLINVVGNPTNHLMVRLRRLVGSVYRRFDRTLCISQSLLVELSDLYALPVGRVGVFRNFLDVPAPKPVFPKDGVRRYVFCGRMVHEKNVDGLLTVWAVFACGQEKLQLVLIGDGPLTSELKSTAAALGLVTGERTEDTTASVLFLGSVPQPQDYMDGAYCFLLPSRHEGVPTVLILALTLGLPVLAADCHSGGVRETLELDNAVRVGRLLPIPEANDMTTVKTWISALEEIDADNALRDRYSAGAATLAKRFDIDAVSAFWEAEIEAVLKR